MPKEKEDPAFTDWWREEGQFFPKAVSETTLEYVRRICFIAWSNGAYKERHKDGTSRDG